MSQPDFEIELISPDTFEDHLIELSSLLETCVAHGASVNFVVPFTLDDSRAFWLEKVRPELRRGTRVLLVAKAAGLLVGSVQLDCNTPPNQPHRAEITKLLVGPEHRRRGFARALMVEAEKHAAGLGRTLITLDTASEAAEALYASLGYQRVGTIPAYSRHPVEDGFDDTMIMFKTF